MTTIAISGDISSRNRLRDAIVTEWLDSEQESNGTIHLHFKTKAQAVDALSQGRKRMIEEERDFNYLRGYALSYDAGRAILVSKP